LETAALIGLAEYCMLNHTFAGIAMALGIGKESTMTISPNDIMKANGAATRTVTAGEEQQGERLALPEPSMRAADAAVSPAASFVCGAVNGYSDASSTGSGTPNTPMQPCRQALSAGLGGSGTNT
jgi:hypothetical protein